MKSNNNKDWDKDTQKIINKDWDILIILDACRYDYFALTYKKYFFGVLKKLISPASNTIEWCKKVFTDNYDDIIYISSNPYINSKAKIEGFDAKKKFYRIIDVWDFGWNKKLGTIHPIKVNEEALKVIKKYPNKRVIIHYIQPHFPYITDGGFNNWSDVVNRNKKINWTVAKWKMLLGNIIKKMLKRKNIWRIKRLFGLKCTHPMEKLIREGGEKKLKEKYAEELEFVMKHVANLLSKINNKKVIITADHGELLGEYGEYGHHPYMHLPKLVEVPWFDVDNISLEGILKEEIEYAELNYQKVYEREKIKNKIKELRRKRRL